VNKGKLRVVAGTVLASGAVFLAVSTPAFPSVFVRSASPPASIDLQTQATLQAKGASVLVSVTILCPEGSARDVSVSVNQRAGSVITAGYGHSSVPCNGEPQTIQVPVNAEPGNRPFKNGPAAATATLYDYWNMNLEDNDVIQIKK
jgi:hypothetical protein